MMAMESDPFVDGLVTENARFPLQLLTSKWLVHITKKTEKVSFSAILVGICSSCIKVNTRLFVGFPLIPDLKAISKGPWDETYKMWGILKPTIHLDRVGNQMMKSDSSLDLHLTSSPTMMIPRVFLNTRSCLGFILLQQHLKSRQPLDLQLQVDHLQLPLKTYCCYFSFLNGCIVVMS